ncbi:hypothetical protein M569_02510 [Genlisea aurea]|uniref:Uncharacterized protein n=1 Tax=Genlisea aurea TaxID=192259 RepID=S8D4F5_9LAMI|nr:hypothetical protein M569_02510 [Genlisea aurea]
MEAQHLWSLPIPWKFVHITTTCFMIMLWERNLLHMAVRTVAGFSKLETVAKANKDLSTILATFLCIFLMGALGQVQMFFRICHNPDEYQSFFQVSSGFSSLILSALTQNAAAYAAASFATTTMWPPYLNMEQPPSVNPSSTYLASIAAATVAAATSWWAANGLLPLCPRLHSGYSCSPSATAIQGEDVNPVPGDQQLDQEFEEAQNSADTESSEAEKVNEGGGLLTAPDAAEVGLKNGKLDRSSCGSNTPSSSEVEGDAQQEKLIIETSDVDLFSRRCRYNSNSIKEVSEEGRLAFQALFSRQVLPQSFSPRQDLKNNRTEKEEEAISLSSKQQEGSLDAGMGHIKLKARRTGFKPYKRCSMEAKETRISGIDQEEVKGTKKLRLEG